MLQTKSRACFRRNLKGTMAVKKGVVEWPEKPTGAGEASVEALPPLGDQSGFGYSSGKAVGVAGSEPKADGGPATE